MFSSDLRERLAAVREVIAEVRQDERYAGTVLFENPNDRSARFGAGHHILEDDHGPTLHADALDEVFGAMRLLVRTHIAVRKIQTVGEHSAHRDSTRGNSGKDYLLAECRAYVSGPVLHVQGKRLFVERNDSRNHSAVEVHWGQNFALEAYERKSAESGDLLLEAVFCQSRALMPLHGQVPFRFKISLI